MSGRITIEFEFVEFIPSHRSEGTLYISMPYATVVHNCLCGCGEKVVTPLHPTGWKLMFDGETVSLSPSIGNWGFRCRSHYIIDHNHVVWADDMSQEKIDLGRQRDRILRDRHFGGTKATPPTRSAEQTAHIYTPKKHGFWARLFRRS